MIHTFLYRKDTLVKRRKARRRQALRRNVTETFLGGLRMSLSCSSEVVGIQEIPHVFQALAPLLHLMMQLCRLSCSKVSCQHSVSPPPSNNHSKRQPHRRSIPGPISPSHPLIILIIILLLLLLISLQQPSQPKANDLPKTHFQLIPKAPSLISRPLFTTSPPLQTPHSISSCRRNFTSTAVENRDKRNVSCDLGPGLLPGFRGGVCVFERARLDTAGELAGLSYQGRRQCDGALRLPAISWDRICPYSGPLRRSPQTRW